MKRWLHSARRSARRRRRRPRSARQRQLRRRRRARWNRRAWAGIEASAGSDSKISDAVGRNLFRHPRHKRTKIRIDEINFVLLCCAEFPRIESGRGSFYKFEAVAPGIADEETLLAEESVAGDYFYAGRFEFLAQCVEIGDAEGGMAARLPIDRRRVLLRCQMQLLNAALVPCAGVTAVGVGGALGWFEAEQFLVKGAGPRERVVAGVDEKV